MIVETVDLIAEWLDDATNGVNAKLTGVDILSGDIRPPDIQSILAETRNSEVARDRFPQDPKHYPALTVTVHDRFALDVSIRNDKWVALSFPVAIGYAIRKDDTKVGLREWEYTARAVLQSLYTLEDPTNAASRTRHNVTLGGITSIDLLPAAAPHEDVFVVGGILTGWRVSDTTPGG